jgi:hypothetical protein
MSIRTTGNLFAEITWTQIEEASLTKISDIGQVTQDSTLTNGTGNSQADAIWHDVRTLPQGSSESFNLTSLTRILFEQEGSMSFVNVKGIIVKNRSEEAGENLAVLATGSTPFDEPFNGGSGNMPVYPLCSLPLLNYIDGWLVDTNNKSISIVNNGSTGIVYEIAVIGVTGT